MNNLATNIAKLLKSKGMTQAQLADKADIDTATVNRVMKGTSPLVAESLSRMAKALGVTVGQLIDPEGNVAPATLGLKKIPVWDHIQAGRFAGVAPNLRDEEMQDFLLTDEKYSDHTFALKIRGDSMEPEFREGDRVVIDPEVRARPGDFVVAKDAKGEATFKQYRPRGFNEKGQDYFELVPLNDVYPHMRSDVQPIKIVGTMVEHRKYRRR